MLSNVIILFHNQLIRETHLAISEIARCIVFVGTPPFSYVNLKLATMYDFYASTDILVNPSFLPF